MEEGERLKDEAKRRVRSTSVNIAGRVNIAKAINIASEGARRTASSRQDTRIRQRDGQTVVESESTETRVEEGD